jgi:hypothetical protein
MIASATSDVPQKPGEEPADLPDVVLIDSTTGLASVISSPLRNTATGTALLRAICNLNPNLVLAPLEPERSR